MPVLAGEPKEPVMADGDGMDWVLGLLKRADTVKCQGKCVKACSAFGITTTEDMRILAWARSHGVEPRSLRKHWAETVRAHPKEPGMPYDFEGVRCPYLTPENRCQVHPVRPVVCLLFGATDLMPCPEGCEMDGPRISAAEARLLLTVVKQTG